MCYNNQFLMSIYIYNDRLIYIGCLNFKRTNFANIFYDYREEKNYTKNIKKL